MAIGAFDADCLFVAGLGVTMLIDPTDGRLAELTGLCLVPSQDAVTATETAETAQAVDGKMMIRDDVAGLFANCSVSAIWSLDPPADTVATLRQLARAFLTDSVLLAGNVETATAPPFPLPPGALNNEWYTFDGRTFLEEVTASATDQYCADLAASGLLGAVPDDVATAILTPDPENPPMICSGGNNGWLIIVYAPSFDGGKGTAAVLPFDVVREVLANLSED